MTARVTRPVALYARVSTRDKDQDQDPEMQLAPMRDYAASRGWRQLGEGAALGEGAVVGLGIGALPLVVEAARPMRVRPSTRA
jgi:hypothetical protein